MRFIDSLVTILVDCDDVVLQGNTMSGVYDIWLKGGQYKLSVYCRIAEGRGWLVLQRRKDEAVSFDRLYNVYEYG